jgi:hypothetical protein
MLILDILFLLWFFLRPVSSRIRGTPLALCRACELKSVILYHSGFVEGKDKNEDKNEEKLLYRHEVRKVRGLTFDPVWLWKACPGHIRILQQVLSSRLEPGLLTKNLDIG